MAENSVKNLKMAIPKGRLYDNVVELLKESGFVVKSNGRSYRPYINDPRIEVKLFKPQNIPKLVELGSQDIAFTGHDWVLEENADVVELIDLGFNPVKPVAAIPEEIDFENLKKKKIRVVSEYENISKKFLKENGIDYIFIKSFGATEVFIPEDADMMIDNTSTGRTIKEHKLKIVSELLKSSTRMIANKNTLKDPFKKKKIDDMLTVMKSVINAREWTFIEMNVPENALEKSLKGLPSMKSPTVTKLNGNQGYSVKIAVKKDEVRELIPKLKEKGASDILVFDLQKVIL